MLDSDKFPSLTPDCRKSISLSGRSPSNTASARKAIVVQAGPIPFLIPARPRRLGPKAGEAPVIGVMDYYRVEGEEIHEVAVGPVHAGNH